VKPNDKDLIQAIEKKDRLIAELRLALQDSDSRLLYHHDAKHCHEFGRTVFICRICEREPQVFTRNAELLKRTSG
jgi:hypothetical protein